MKSSNWLRVVSIIFLIFLALNAIGGGLLLIIDPSGGALQVSLDLLEGTPFDDYMIPGIILVLANGILSIAVAIIAIKRIKNYPMFIILQGFVLIDWLTIEVILNSKFFTPHLHYPLYTIGLFFVIAGVAIKKMENSNEE